MLIVPVVVVPGPRFREMRNSLIADQLAAVVVLICSGTRTNFHPLKSMRLAPTVESKVISLGPGTLALGRGVA